MHILFWVDKFPLLSETFIRDQIISVVAHNHKVTIHTKNRKINTSELNALTGFEKYNLQDKVVPIDVLFPRKKWKRILRFSQIILQNIFSKNLKYYVKTLDVKSFNAEAKSLQLFFKTHFLLKNKVEIIHAHFGPNGQDATVFKKIGLPIKLFTTFHGYDIRLAEKKGGEIYTDLFAFADGIFSISNYNTTSLLHFGAPKNKILPLSNGVDVSFFKRETPLIKTDKIKILTVARLVAEKDLSVAIHAVSKAIEKYPNIEYHIIGEGEARNTLQNKIDALGLSSQIKLLGAKNSTQVRDAMVSSHLFLLSSKAEALPTVLLEAQAAGLVVLATNVGSVKDMVKSGVVVQSENTAAFTTGLLSLLDKQSDWLASSALGSTYITENYSITKQANTLLEYYKK
ncbi:glycosyltransferase [Lacinutrix gracilariae]|uniref:Glycosyltransferase n=1 Tax=Lacinutrix gracilariae TaxID=1747198 RepID=A0ABW5K0E8_9FLAO